MFKLISALNLPRYKYLVQVVIGEQKGAGVRMGCRCFWDDQTDSVATETFVNVRHYHVEQDRSDYLFDSFTCICFGSSRNIYSVQ